MYSFKRAMKSFKNIPSNKHYVDGNIKESHIVAKGVVYAKEHLSNSKDGNHKATREVFLDVDSEYRDEGPVGFGDKIVTLSDVQFIQIGRWVLFRREVEGLAEYYVEYDERSTTTDRIYKLERERKINSKLWRYVKGHVEAKGYERYKVNAYTFSSKSNELSHVTQDSGVCMETTTTYRASCKDKNPVDGVTKWYGVVKQILELDYTEFTEVVFYCDWVKVENKSHGCRMCSDSNLVLVYLKIFRSSESYYDEPAILDFEASQVFYSTDLKDPDWSVVISSPKSITIQVDNLLKPQFEDFQSILAEEPHLQALLVSRSS